MPARVRIPVEHGEASLAAIDHQVLFIPIRLSRFTKDAAVFGMLALYIGGSPGSPQMCHSAVRIGKDLGPRMREPVLPLHSPPYAPASFDSPDRAVPCLA